MEKTGLTHLYYGDGKGKTTAALGLVLRASGQGKRALIVQFLKNAPCGELAALQKLDDVLILRGQAGMRFSCNMSQAEREETARIHNEHLSRAIALARDDRCDLLVLDEALDALSEGMLDEALLFDLLEHKPAALELVITGHGLDARVAAHADYVTHMVKEKHPYDAGVTARRGVEY